MYWTNLTQMETLEEEVGRVERDTGLLVSDILEPVREVKLVEREDGDQQYVCNFRGMQRRAWPTLMASQSSYAFRMRGGRPRPWCGTRAWESGQSQQQGSEKGQWVPRHAAQAHLA